MVIRTSWILFYIAFLHFIGIYLFTRGFLLSRLSLSTIADCSPSDSPCTLPPTHKRAILLIIDALRFDFLSPHPPEPHSTYHHNVLTLPRELTAKQPHNSFLFNAYADPPTTTLQRIKGLVTGSLPTFVDMGYNFGGASIAEDSIILQLQQANKTVRPPPR
jgi:GPI ethanolamine phosphate transferase 3 subunit O